MALSGSFTGTTNNQYIQPKITWSATQDIAGNFSTVTATLTYSRTNSGYTTEGKWSGSITINGTTTNYSTSNTIFITQNSNTVAMSATVKVPHDNDGKKSVYISCTGGMISSSVTLKTTTCASNITLNQIPRQATLTSAPAFTDLDNPTIKYSNPAGSAVSGLDACISFTGAKDDIPYRAISKTGNSYTFSLTETERNTLRNATPTGTRDVIFYVRTIIGGKTFYSTSTKKLTIRETDKTKPSVTMTATLNNGSLPITFAEVYIQGKSRLDITLSAQGKYKASISSYSASVGGDSYSGSSFTTNAIAKSGEVDVIGYAKDSRGFTGSASKKISVLAYSKPLVIPIGNENAILCYRSDGNGVRVGNSTSVWVKAKRSYYSLSGNNKCMLQWRRKLISEATWNGSIWKALITDKDTTDEYNGLISEVFELNKSYSIQIRAVDDIGEYDIKEFEIPTQDVALHLGAGGKKASFGTYCNDLPDYTLYSDWLSIFDKGILGSLLNHNVTDVLEFPKDCIDGITPIIINSSTNKNNLPAGDYAYSVGIVHKRAADQYNVILVDYVSGKIAINVHLSGTWTGWKYITPQ